MTTQAPTGVVDTTDSGNDISTFANGVPDLSDDILIEGPIVVGQGVARRLTMDRGALFYRTDAGINLLVLVNYDPAPGDLERWQELATKEALSVDGVQSAKTTITLVDRVLRVLVELVTIGGTRLQVIIDDAVQILVQP